MLRQLTLSAALLLATGSVVLAQDSKADSRVEGALKQTDIKFKVDNDGDFKIEYPCEDNRTQVLFVNSNTEKYGALEVREVWSVAMRTKDLLSAQQANDLLVATSQLKLGSWELRQQTVKGEKEYWVMFVAKIPADIGPKDIETVIRYTAIAADRKEKEMTGGKDDF
jgi:hypothetical protein